MVFTTKARRTQDQSATQPRGEPGYCGSAPADATCMPRGPGVLAYHHELPGKPVPDLSRFVQCHRQRGFLLA